MKALASNRELRDYLVHLPGRLASVGLHELSRGISDVSRLDGGMSTEFLGESRIVLRKVATQNGLPLSREERHTLKSVLSQLDDALDRTRH
jgi:hypothetical protein